MGWMLRFPGWGVWLCWVDDGAMLVVGSRRRATFICARGGVGGVGDM